MYYHKNKRPLANVAEWHTNAGSILFIENKYKI